ncbi:WXG100 family type VII secretion target [Lentzea cavernae]|uniref:Excreted virulence factor EspC, type VII ESX diderm n=1 Tax=Lentzea cavernae TaxID=2020703 RepID=A0ABQ3MEV5_9PSEU|nr:type VII secretion target [Lentzea cavernae]GHH42846.1 hypothetical protein GCM10017774_39860 [Lentzea cavernae]
MSDGFVVDVAAVRVTAERLDDAGEALGEVVDALGLGSAGDLGPGVTEAADELMRSWEDKVAALRSTLADASAELRSAAAAYRDADELGHG